MKADNTRKPISRRFATRRRDSGNVRSRLLRNCNSRNYASRKEEPCRDYVTAKSCCKEMARRQFANANTFANFKFYRNMLQFIYVRNYSERLNSNRPNAIAFSGDSIINPNRSFSISMLNVLRARRWLSKSASKALIALASRFS